jgi:pimeloyl-ACP methyl ester carboxylesterase
VIVEDSHVEQRTHGEPLRRFRKTVLRVPGDAARFLVRKTLPEGPSRRTPVLLLHGFGQNRRAWHQPQRSLANHLAAPGFDVFNAELRGHGRSRRAGVLPLHDLAVALREDLPETLALIRALTTTSQTFVLGHSLGGLLSYGLAAARPDEVAGVVTLASPLHFGEGNAALRALGAGLRLADPAGHRAFPMAVIRAGLRRSAALWDLPWVPLPVRAWAPGSLEPALRDEYLRTAFDGGTFGELRGVLDAQRAISLGWSRCEVPALVIAGSHDLLAPVDSVRPGYTLHPGPDRTWWELPFGHADVILGRDAPAQVWPVITRWLTARDGVR